MTHPPPTKPPPAQPILAVKDLHKHYPIFSKGLRRRKIDEIRACDGVSFALDQGETIGLVGESGCGKTTTGRAILRAIEPTSGSVLFRSSRGLVDLATLPAPQLKPLRRELQMIFQDPFSSLNPRMTVGRIVGEPLYIHDAARGSERDDRVCAMLRRVGIQPEFRHRYPHAFSGGQRQRIGIARALILQPTLVVADEAVSALDVSVQAQIINLLADLQHEFHLTLIFIAHDLSVVQHICHRVAVMHRGRIVESGPTRQIFQDPRHPYTRTLLSAIPQPDPDIPLPDIPPYEPDA